MKAIFLHASTDGHTIKIMDFLKSQMRCDHFDMVKIDSQTRINFNDYDLVIIGASIRFGHYQKKLYDFIDRYHPQLNDMPSYFFGINLVARKTGKNTPETNIYTRKFLQKVPWKPKKTAVFAGACSWSQYNFWQTKIIQLIMLMTKGPTDTSQDIIFTDWDDVRAFARSL